MNCILVEDDKLSIQHYYKAFKTSKCLNICGVFSSSIDTISWLKHNSCDIIILDIELSKGEGSGLDVLKELKYIEKKPFILIVTNNISQTVYNVARNLGADYIISKQQKNFSENYVLNFLTMIKANTELNDFNISHTGDSLDIINHELQSLGFNPKYIGYKYLVDAIYLISMDEKDIINKISLKYSKSSASVERAMKNLIDLVWKRSDPDDLLINYTAAIDPRRGTPTLTEFIYYFGNKCKNRN